jgi:hypothetical protein
MAVRARLALPAWAAPACQRWVVHMMAAHQLPAALVAAAAVRPLMQQQQLSRLRLRQVLVSQ